jgi:hypothetical protein
LAKEHRIQLHIRQKEGKSMLSLTKRKMLITSLVIILIASIASFAVWKTVNDNYVTAQGASSEPATKASSVEDASRIAGYRVVTPNLALAGFEASEVNSEIWVVQLHTYSRGPESRSVEQDWTLKDGTWFTLVQLPRPGESIQSVQGGELVNIGSLIGKRIYFEAEYGVPPRVVFYWYDNDMRYSLGGTLTESLSEEMLIKLVQSVRVK